MPYHRSPFLEKVGVTAPLLPTVEKPLAGMSDISDIISAVRNVAECLQINL